MGDEAKRGFHQDLEDLQTQIVRLAALVTEAIPRATRALLDMDLALAQAVIDNDDELDAQSLLIEERCLRMLTLQQPMAGDLRRIFTAIKMNAELERAGDLSVNICKTIRRIYGTSLDPKIRGLLEQMSDEAHMLTRTALDAFVTNDVELAGALDDMDDSLDVLHTEYVHAILEAHESRGLDLQTAVQLALIGRYYERIGDHAVVVGERTQYMITGTLPETAGVARARDADSS